MSASHSTWSLEAVEALSEAGSWTARIHVHKLLYLAKELLGVQHPFTFELYRFGPYSFELDATIRDLEVCGLLEKDYRQPGYGPTYAAAADWHESVSGKVPEEARAALRTLARRIGRKSGGELELLATCCWVDQSGQAKEDEKIIAEVKKIKTHASEEAIRTQLATFRKLRAEMLTDK